MDYIYGCYFDVIAQERFNIDTLSCSKIPIKLSSTARFITSQYLEVYNDIKGITIILCKSESAASLQYSANNKYYYQSLTPGGLTGNIPKTYVTHLSHNLRHL